MVGDDVGFVVGAGVGLIVGAGIGFENGAAADSGQSLPVHRNEIAFSSFVICASVHAVPD